MTKIDNTLSVDAYRRLLAQQEEADRKAKRRKKPGHEESLIQRAFVAWFRAQYPEHALRLCGIEHEITL